MELTFNVTLDEANIILAGLGELPTKVSAGLVTKLQQQAGPQIQAQQETAAEEVENG